MWALTSAVRSSAKQDIYFVKEKLLEKVNNLKSEVFVMFWS